MMHNLLNYARGANSKMFLNSNRGVIICTRGDAS